MTQEIRICSLLPSATEIVCALGARDSLVGVSHGCDFPDEVRTLPVVTKSIVPPGLSSRQIDDLVSGALREGRSLYELDIAEVDRLRPDVIVTQELCDVCAVDFATVTRSLAQLAYTPELVSLQPSNIADILDDVARVARTIKRESEALVLIEQSQARLKRVSEASEGCPLLRVAALEWLDPLFYAGHWVPEQVALAGGTSCWGQAQMPSGRLTWEQLEHADPDLIVLMPCGYDLEQTLSLAEEIKANRRYQGLRAVRTRNVWAVDANSYFSRPSPGVVEGAELLARILHDSPWRGAQGAFAHVD